MLRQKRNAGRAAAEYVEDGMVVGLGSGSTAKHAVEKIGNMVQDGIEVVGVPTSETTRNEAEDLDIPLATLDEVSTIDLTIDGADEVDPEFNLIKGGGGALLREKIVAEHSEKEIIVVDPTKMVETLGEGFALPVEIVPFWAGALIGRLDELECNTSLRMRQNQIYKTDNGNYIVDCNFEMIDEPRKLSERLNQIAGVIENGLFIDKVDKVIIGNKKGFEEISVD